MLKRSQLHKKAVLGRILRDLQNLSQGQINLSNVTSESVHKRIADLENDRKKLILAAAKTPEEKEVLMNVGIDTASLQTALLDMTMKGVSEDELLSLGHGLDEMLKYCRWSYYSCHKG